jgi:hypothetical protein
MRLLDSTGGLSLDGSNHFRLPAQGRPTSAHLDSLPAQALRGATLGTGPLGGADGGAGASDGEAGAQGARQAGPKTMMDFFLPATPESVAASTVRAESPDRSLRWGDGSQPRNAELSWD